MRKLLIILLLINLEAYGLNQCFLVMERNSIFQQEGECEKRYPPCSTFKIVLSLIGYDSGILKDELLPVWPFREGYSDYLDIWKKEHNPTTWMKNSCVWYSQILTQRLGIKKLKKYITNFRYGNMDISGDLNKFWLSNSLKISPIEQVKFLQKLINNKLPTNHRSCKITKKLLFIKKLPNNWNLYGKTGNCSTRSGLQEGWFVGWIEKKNKKIIFINHIRDETEETTFASLRAKSDTEIRLKKLIGSVNPS